MPRSSWIGLAALAWLTAGSPAAAEPAAVELGIAARAQAAEAPEQGWCAETALQEALLYYGAYLPQRAINRAGRPRNPDLYWSDLPRAMTGVGLLHRRWHRRTGLAGFLAWTRRQLVAGRPVLAGVKIYPTAHPRWSLDHIVLVTGFAAGRLRINTTWGHAIRRTAAELHSTAAGISLRNRSRRQHAYAIDGLVGRGADEPTVRLRVIGQRRAAIDVEVQVRGLAVGRSYRIERAGSARGKTTRRWRFTARGAIHRLRLRLDRDRPAYLRACPDDRGC